MASSPKHCPRCGASLSARTPEGLCPKCLVERWYAAEDEEPITPEELAPYFPQLEIIELLGHGGMGVVYRAKHKALGRVVALKLLQPDLAGNPAFASRFEKEAKLLARLDHQNIVKIFDSGKAGRFCYLLMEFVDGPNLRNAMQQGRLTTAQKLGIVRSVCDALEYAHGEGIVHRDIKPENLLLDQSGRVKVADFGIAKLLDPEEESQTLTVTRPVGTPQYMAPEQKAVATIDQRVDIYSLGIVLHELLTGERPNGASAPTVRTPLDDPGLEAVIQRALAAKPAERFSTAGALRDALTNGTASAPVSPSAKPSHRKWIVGGVILSILPIASAILLLPRRGAVEAATIPRQPAVSATTVSAPIATNQASARTFLFAQGVFPRSTNFILRPDGAIRGNHGTTEANWVLKGEWLNLFDEDGKVTCSLRSAGNEGREFYHAPGSGLWLYQIFPGQEKSDISSLLAPLVGNTYVSEGFGGGYYWRVISPHQIVEVEAGGRASREWVERVYSVPDSNSFICRSTLGRMFRVKVLSKDVLEQGFLAGKITDFKRIESVPPSIEEAFHQRNLPLKEVTEAEKTPSTDPLREKLVGKVFQWGRASDDVIFTRNFTLSATGQVTGYRHENECFWTVRDGRLVLFGHEHRPGCVLELRETKGKGLLFWQIGGPHYLQELPPPDSKREGL